MSTNPRTGALEAPLTSVTPRSVSVGIGAELAPGALEAILTDAGPIAAEAIYALRAKAAPWAIRTHVTMKEKQMLLLHGLNLNSASVLPEVTSHSLQEAESFCYHVGCKNGSQLGEPDLGFRTLRDKVQGCAV